MTSEGLYSYNTILYSLHITESRMLIEAVLMLIQIQN